MVQTSDVKMCLGFRRLIRVKIVGSFRRKGNFLMVGRVKIKFFGM